MILGKVDLDIQNLSPHQDVLTGVKVGEKVTLSRFGEEVRCITASGSLLGFLDERQSLLVPDGTTASVRSLRRSQQGDVVQLLVRTSGDNPQQGAKRGHHGVVKDIDASHILKRSSLESLAASDEIQELLRSSRLQEDILTVDRALDREKVLDEALKHADFRIFCDKNPSPQRHGGMFGNIIDALQGPAATAVDSDSDTSSPELKDTLEHTSMDSQAAPVLSSIWGMATKLADTVKKGTAEIAASVAETNWKAELEAFGKEVAEDAHEASTYTVERLEALPDSVRNVPDKLTQLPPVDSERVQQSLQQVGNKLRGFGASFLTNTASLFEQVQEAIAQEIEGIDGHINRSSRPANRSANRQSASTAKYSRLDADISAMQRNSSTYCDEPEDTTDYTAWLVTFDLSSKRNDIEQLTASNAFMSELQSRIVPLIVQYDVFWTRYFYQLHKLQQKHEQLQALTQRATRASAEEEVGWDDDEAAPTPRANTKPGLNADADNLSRPAQSTESELPEVVIPPKAAEEGSEPPAEYVKPVLINPKCSAEDIGSSTSSPIKGREDEPETSTASDDSGNAPWTVVKAPNPSGEDHHDDSSSVVSTAAAESAALTNEAVTGSTAVEPQLETTGQDSSVGATEGQCAGEKQDQAQALSTEPCGLPGLEENQPSTQNDSENSDLSDDDLELSEDDGVVPGPNAAGSDVDEDWGSWE